MARLDSAGFYPDSVTNRNRTKRYFCSLPVGRMKGEGSSEAYKLKYIIHYGFSDPSAKLILPAMIDLALPVG